jgi:hypothetical protein
MLEAMETIDDKNSPCMKFWNWYDENWRETSKRVCDMCCETCTALGQNCGPPDIGCFKSGWIIAAPPDADCAAGEVAELSCPGQPGDFEGGGDLGYIDYDQCYAEEMHQMEATPYSQFNFPDPSQDSTSDLAEAMDIVEDTTMEVSTEMLVSPESLDAMLESPKKAVKGLKKGIADGLGLDSDLVTITHTEPDLLGGNDDRRLQGGRRNTDSASLVVDFEVAVGQAESPLDIVASLSAMENGNTAVIESLTGSITQGLESKGLEVKIVGMTAEVAAYPTAGPEPWYKADPSDTTTDTTTVPEPPESVDNGESAGAPGRLGVGIFMAMILQVAGFGL